MKIDAFLDPPPMVAQAEKKKRVVERANGLQDCMLVIPIDTEPLDLSLLTGKPISRKPYDSERERDGHTEFARRVYNRGVTEIRYELSPEEEAEFVARTLENAK